DAGPPRLLVLVDDHAGVLVETDIGAVGTAPLLAGADDDCLDDVAFLHRPARVRLFDGADDHIADAGIAAAGPAEHADAQHLAGAGVVGDLEAGFLLDHRARSTTSTTRQRFCLLSGRVSMIRTVSPTRASFSSSWAWKTLDRRTILS